MGTRTRWLWIASEQNSSAEVESQALPEGVDRDIVPDAAEGLRLLNALEYDLVLAVFPLPDWTPEELLEQVQAVSPAVPLIIRDPGGAFSDAVRLTKLGAFHYFGAGMDSRDLERCLQAAIAYRRSRETARLGVAAGNEPWRRFLVGESRAMQSVAHIVRLIAARRCTVLITGETGTGKEMVARAIHMAGNRSHLPLVAVNCNALPENLLEAELFGHVKGAFTGAIGHRIGRFEQAHRGTLFLDEIGDMPLEIQAKFLRALQEREFQRLGSSETVRVDVRVVAASNADLAERIGQGKFREDLYYRLNVVPLKMPALRERLEDISPLVHHFLDKICRQEDIPPKQVVPETIDRLAGYSWPGNVRQLENAVEMAIALSGDRRTLYPGDFPLPQAAETRRPLAVGAPFIRVPDSGLDYERTVGRIERSILEQALEKTGGNKKQAADMLRLKRTTLSAKLKSLEAVAC
jgi:DNA-binding NtrC family response regulator